jgi:hypothetical protein
VASLPSIIGKPQATLLTYQKEKIFRQLGGIHAALSNIRLNEISLLFVDKNELLYSSWYSTHGRCAFVI